eukprot:gene51598-30402_t
MPGNNQEQYNDVVRICIEDGMSFVIVWEADWGSAWFFIWMRNLLDAHKAGCTMVVLTQDRGNVGRAQSTEVLLMEVLQIPYVCIDIADFITQRRPFHALVADGKWDSVRQLLESGAGAFPALLKQTGRQTGHTPLIAAVNAKGAPHDVLRKMIERGADVNQPDSKGNTAMHEVATVNDPTAL